MSEREHGDESPNDKAKRCGLHGRKRGPTAFYPARTGALAHTRHQRARGCPGQGTEAGADTDQEEGHAMTVMHERRA